MDNKVHIKTGDTVMVLSGSSKGKKGKVVQVAPKEKKAIVEGVNYVSKHVKPKRQGEQGGIIKTEGAIYTCKLQLVCPKCDKPTRIAYEVLENGKKVRKCKKCGEVM